MSKPRWKAFPHPDAAYEYAAATLRSHWSRLHRGDCEPFPDADHVRKLIAAHPRLDAGLQPAKMASGLQDAWRAYHRGDFEHAVELGLSLGPIGYNIANKATNIYATYLAPSQNALALFRESARRAEELQACAPTLANAWYLHAQALGRYSQGISIGVALAEGVADKVKRSLERTIDLEPRHADAHIALGAYDAEIIEKMGSLIASITYGASKDAAVENFKKALKLDPDSVIARIEYANALISMYGRARAKEAGSLYEEAAACVPADAMESLDVELASAKSGS